MKPYAVFACVFFVVITVVKAQPSLQLDYFSKVPVNISNCGALYSYHTVALAKKKYILLTDFQNLGLITIKGKQVNLQLADIKTIHQSNITTYKGAGYTVVLTVTTTSHKGKWDIETGSLQVISGTKKIVIKIHGQSGCDESKQEGNG